MADGRISVLIVGVGGQGLLTAARIMGDAVHTAGGCAVVGQLHGMSQRGGSVECSVLVGKGSSSYLSRADVVVGFEPLETLRALHRMDHETRVVMNSVRFALPTLVRQGQPYPPQDEIVAEIRGGVGEVVVLEGQTAAREEGVNTRALNIFMLGALSGLGWLPIEEPDMLRAVERHSGHRFLEANRTAFAVGRSAVITEGIG